MSGVVSVVVFGGGVGVDDLGGDGVGVVFVGCC